MIRWSRKKDWTSSPRRCGAVTTAHFPHRFGEGFEPLVRFGEQLRRDGQVDRGGGGVDVAHERREREEPRLWVEALSIPAQQARDRERVAKAVEVGRPDPVGDRKGELADKTVESLACAARVHAALAVEAEQRSLTSATATLDLAGEEFADTRPVGNEPALAELAAPHDEELPVVVDVTDTEAARLPSSQPEAIAEGEDRR